MVFHYGYLPWRYKRIDWNWKNLSVKISEDTEEDWSQPGERVKKTVWDVRDYNRRPRRGIAKIQIEWYLASMVGFYA